MAIASYDKTYNPWVKVWLSPLNEKGKNK